VNPIQVLALAKTEAPFMLAVLSLVGLKVKQGHAHEAFLVLRSLSGAPDWPAKCWALVDGWQEREKLQGESGVSAVVFAAALIMRDVPYWRDVDWPDVIDPVEEKPTLPDTPRA